MKIYVLLLISAFALMYSNAIPTEGPPSTNSTGDGIIVIPESACPSLLASSTSCDQGAAWMCARGEFRNSLSRWLVEFKVWWNSCPGFATKDWATFASKLISIRTAAGFTDMPPTVPTQGFVGWDGFRLLWSTLIPCPRSAEGIGCSINEPICASDSFSCFVCYCTDGQYINLAGMLSLWRREVLYQSALVKAQAVLREMCVGSVTGGCVVPVETTVAPTTTISMTGTPEG